LIKKIGKFSSIIETAASELKPHHLATYARELADAFNQFYRYVPVLNAEESLRNSRLVLVDCARTAMREALNSLGIFAPENM
jgi:arginyl-tRNA synthetase